jgi:hypothetical protein
MMPNKPLSGWDGPAPLTECVLRYSKCLSWMRLCIDIADGELSGGTRGCPRNYEVAKEDGRWMLYETEIASTPAGEPVLRLYAYTTWDVVYERVSSGRPVEEEIEGTEKRLLRDRDARRKDRASKRRLPLSLFNRIFIFNAIQ